MYGLSNISDKKERETEKYVEYPDILVKGVFFGPFLIAFFVIASICNAAYNEIITTQNLAQLNSGDSLNFEIRNEYPKLESLKQYPWKYIAEPHRTSILTIQDPQDDATYTWDISKKVNPNGSKGFILEKNQGPEISVIFTDAPQLYILDIVEVGGKNRRIQAEVMCKYARREIRDLTQEDKKKFFRALKIFHMISLEEGREKYGQKFFNHKELTKLHLKKEVDTQGSSCTPWHSGPVFITSHLAMTMWVEQALQLIEPSIAFPYWDYIEDSVTYGLDWSTQSPIFSDEYMGTYEDYPHQLAGQWKDIPLSTVNLKDNAKAEDDMSYAHNSYGVLTDWYNNDDATTLHRSNKICGWKLQQVNLPGCSAIQDVLTSNSLGSAQEYIEGSLHGSKTHALHGLMGGAWDCAEDYQTVMQNYGTDANGLAAQKIAETFLIKAIDMWSDSYTDSLYSHRGVCSSEVPFEECRLTCSEIQLEEMDNLPDDEIYEYLSSFGYLRKISPVNDMVEDASSGHLMFAEVDSETDASLKRNLLKLGCNPGRIAPFSSPYAAPDDPLFLLSHSYYQLYWSYLLLTKPNFSLQWLSDEVEADETRPICYGHSLHDTLPSQWYGFNGEQQNEDNSLAYTNADLLRVFHPTNPKLPYIHAKFNWEYCNK